MFELLADALKAMAGYPPMAAFGGLCVLGIGIWVMLRGEQHRKSNGNVAPVPAWTLYGPVHDVMLAIQQMAEESRAQTHIIERSEEILRDIVKQQVETKQILELIRNESRLR